jgi:hypothetical protein
MLWIPDTVCGAVTSARTGVSTYLAQSGELGSRVIEI